MRLTVVLAMAPASASPRPCRRGSILPEVPFGGFGESGLGHELGAHALSACTEPNPLFLTL